MTQKSKSPSALFWAEIQTRLKANTSAIANGIGVNASVISRARASAQPLQGVVAEHRQSLLLKLAGTFGQLESCLKYLDKLGWERTAEETALLTNGFSLRAQVGVISPYYVSRPALETAILDQVLPSSRTSGESPRKGVLLTGLGGNGKTTLALAAIRACADWRAEFPDGVFVINCAQRSGADLIATFLNEVKARQPRPVDLDRTALKRQVSLMTALIVLDDVQDVAVVRLFFALLGECVAGRLIVTTRLRLAPQLAVLQLSPIEVPALTVTEAEHLMRLALKKSVAEEQRAAFEAVVERVGGHPMALTILAGRVDLLKASWSDVLHDLARFKLAELEYPDAASADDSVRQCFELTYATLLDTSPEAAACFRAIWLFPPSGSTVAWLRRVTHQPDSPSLLGENKLLERLARQHLLDLTEASEQTWSTHILLRDFAEDKLLQNPDEHRQIARRYLHTVAEWLEPFAAQSSWTSADFATFEKHVDDLQQAVYLACAESEAALAVDLVCWSMNGLLTTSLLDLAASLIRRVEQTWPIEQLDPALAVRFRRSRADLARQTGQVFTAIEDFIHVWRFEADAVARIEVLCDLGYCYLELGDYNRVAGFSRSIERRLADLPRSEISAVPRAVLQSRFELLQAALARAEQRVATAHDHYQQAEAILNRTGNLHAQLRVAFERSHYLVESHQPAKGLELLDEVSAQIDLARWPVLNLQMLRIRSTALVALRRWAEALQVLDLREAALKDLPEVAQPLTWEESDIVLLRNLCYHAEDEDGPASATLAALELHQVFRPPFDIR